MFTSSRPLPVSICCPSALQERHGAGSHVFTSYRLAPYRWGVLLNAVEIMMDQHMKFLSVDMIQCGEICCSDGTSTSRFSPIGTYWKIGIAGLFPEAE